MLTRTSARNVEESNKSVGYADMEIDAKILIMCCAVRVEENGGFNCKHGYSASHRYCPHYTNTTVTSHKYCSHNYNGVQHD